MLIPSIPDYENLSVIGRSFVYGACIRLILFPFFDYMFAFVQLYPTPLSDKSGPEMLNIFWYVDGFVDGSGEIMNGNFSL